MQYKLMQYLNNVKLQTYNLIHLIVIAHRAERDKNLALSLAHQKKAVMKPLSNLQEVNHFLQQLFACLLPSITPSGKKIFEVMDVEKMF